MVDDPEVGAQLETYFTDRGQHVTRVSGGRAALDQMTALPPYDVALLGLMLPEKAGIGAYYGRRGRRGSIHRWSS